MRKMSLLIMMLLAVLTAQAQFDASSDPSFERTPLSVIQDGWKTKVITDVPTAGIGIMLERFDMTWPTGAVGDVCQVMQTGVAKKVLDKNDGYTVEVDAQNGYVESYNEGSDRQTMSACVWRRTNGHRLFAVVISQPVDPEIELVCFYDYDPQKHILTPEPDILDKIQPLFPTAYMNFVLPKVGKDLIVSEYSSGNTYKRIYKWNGMLPVYDRTERESMGLDDTEMMNAAGPSMSFPVKFSGAKPGISDFVTAILSQEELCDSQINVAANWKKRLSGKKLANGVSIVVDERNGYFRFEMASGSSEVCYTEYCNWNCSDGKHKLVAENTGVVINGKYENTECTGLMFYLYDNETRELTYTSPYDMGAGIQVNPVVSYSLPRTGKDIMADINDEKHVVKIRMKWNGMKFNQEQVTK